MSNTLLFLLKCVLIFVAGLLTGALAIAVAYDPDDFLTSVGKIQNIIGATIALMAAAVAYNAQALKVESDESARRETQHSKVHALRDEIGGRMDAILSWVSVGADAFARASDQDLISEARSHRVVATPAISVARSRITPMWEGFEAAPRDVRGGALETMLEYEGFLDKAEHYLGMVKAWENVKVADYGKHRANMVERSKTALSMLRTHRDKAFQKR